MTQEQFETLLYKYRYQLLLSLGGVFLVGLGLFLGSGSLFDRPKIEIIESSSSAAFLHDEAEIVVEVSGEVERPGLYRFESGARGGDALAEAGGVTESADHDFLDKAVNQAAKLLDGQKIYIPHVDEQSTSGSANGQAVGFDTQNVIGVQSEKKVNINAASKSQLESLWGIGPVTAQNIIERRPYSSVEELSEKKILKSNVYERNKDLLSVF